MIKEIEGTNLIAVVVPSDSSNAGWMYDCFTVDIPNEDGTVKYRWISEVDEYLSTIGKNNYLNTLGFVTKDKIGFDVEPYVDLFSVTRMGWFGYKNYLLSEDKNKNFTCKTKEESFYSRLAANGIYFENPMGEKQINVEEYMAGDGDMWQSYENGLIKKLLIIEKT